MSAFMVGKTHIDAMLTAGLFFAQPRGNLRWWFPKLDPKKGYINQERNRRELTHETAGRVGAMLLAENRRSVNYRYEEDEIEEPYLFTELRGTPDAIITLKAVACYEYQSCEHAEWEESEAYQFCESLRRVAINKLPGYEKAPWEISDPGVFLRLALGR